MDYSFVNPEQDLNWSQSKQSNYDDDEEFSELNRQLTDKLSLETDWIFSFNNANQFPQINSTTSTSTVQPQFPIASTSATSEAHLQNLFNSKPNTFPTSLKPSSFKSPSRQSSLSTLAGDSVPNYNPLQPIPIPSTVTVWFGGLPVSTTPELLAKALQHHDCPPIALPTVIDRSHCAFASFIDPNIVTRLSSFEIGGKTIKFRIKHATGQVASSLSDAGLLPKYDINFNTPSTSKSAGQRPATSPIIHSHMPNNPHMQNKAQTQDRARKLASMSQPSLGGLHRQPTPTRPSTPTQPHVLPSQPTPSASGQNENSAVAAAAAAASITALSVLKTPQAIQAASSPDGPGKEVLEQTQHYLGLLVDGFQTQASKVVDAGGGHFFEQAENIAEKLKEPTEAFEKDDSAPLPQSEEEPSVVYTWKGDKRPRRFFILKALSKNDLDTARQENRWSTQPQNEDILNKAFNEASHVILFMSANKQRGFYGLARMNSKIPKERNPKDAQEEVQSNLQAHFSPHVLDSESFRDVKEGQTGLGVDEAQEGDGEYRWSAPGQMQDAPSLNVQPSERQYKSDPMHAPHGEFTQHSSDADNRTPRGVLDRSLLSPQLPLSQQTPSPMDILPPTDEQMRQREESQQRTRTFGHPFSVEWLSTRPVPFSKLKGINNPWNANRPVKVSRDGTEVETKVGERLVEEFGLSASQLPVYKSNDILVVIECYRFDEPVADAREGEFANKSAIVSGFAAAVALQPFDVIKTRLQQVEGHNESISRRNLRSLVKSTRVYDITKGIIREEGLRGLWRGTSPTLWRNVPGVALYFTSLQSLRSYMIGTGLFLPKAQSSTRTTSEFSRLNSRGNLLSGALARTAVGFLLNPFTVCKARFESDLYRYKSIAGALTDIVKQSGPRGLLSGFSASALRDAPYAGLYVVLYERLKEYGSHLQENGNSIPAPVVYSVSGLLAGTASTLITHPFDVVKTKMQIFPHQYTSLSSSIVTIVRNSPRSLFAGSGIRITRKALSSAIGWTAFEELARVLKSKTPTSV
ncbi:hypothetical protein E3P99_02078 [Wallemia hederae]|uniref:Mitochondrial glycine transporter n=1 Tax=Wallemia hederae TaxID=1540922 RepID=A0A4T0FM48_9BASI|nr:hypothetical protein E3P99_02078 [Wallemia hederae]